MTAHARTQPPDMEQGRKPHPLYHEISKATPRTAAILSGVIIEDHLKQLLKLSTRDISHKFDSMSHFEAMAWAYRLGLIEADMLRELEALRRICSHLAASSSIDTEFETGEIARLVDCLQSPVKFFGATLHERIFPKPALITWWLQHTNRDWWELSIQVMLGKLEDLIQGVIISQMQEPPWSMEPGPIEPSCPFANCA